MTVSRRDRDGVSIITLVYPPVNALSVGGGLVDALAYQVRDAVEDASIAAIVLTGAGGMFCGGGDLSDFDGDMEFLQRVRACLEVIESAPKPVVAALNGAALGGGLELALAAHYRIAKRSITVALPEVGLGIIPGAGGTQRLPRVSNASDALRLITSGKPIDCEAARSAGIIDLIVEGDPVEASIAWINEPNGLRSRPTRDRPVCDDLATAAASAAAQYAGALNSAPARAIECVAAAVALPFEAGLDKEMEICRALMQTEVSRALRYLFFAERRAGALPRSEPPMRPSRARIVVAGRSAGISILVALCARGEVPVVHYPESDRSVLEAAPFSQDAPDMVILEDPADELLDALTRLLAPGMVIALSTGKRATELLEHSGPLSPYLIAFDLDLWSLEQRAVEIVVGRSTSPATLERVAAWIRSLRRIPVFTRAGVTVGSTLVAAFQAEADAIIGEGVDRAQLEHDLAQWGIAAGPLRRTAGTVRIFDNAADTARVERCVRAVADGAQQLVGVDTGTKASDIDVLFTAGFGFPAERGGPLFWTERSKARGCPMSGANNEDTCC